MLLNLQLLSEYYYGLTLHVTISAKLEHISAMIGCKRKHENNLDLNALLSQAGYDNNPDRAKIVSRKNGVINYVSPVTIRFDLKKKLVLPC